MVGASGAIAAVLYFNAHIIGAKWKELFADEPEEQGLLALSYAASLFMVCGACALVNDTALALVLAAVGLYVGRELRARYKFNHRTQYDFFSHAGDSVCAADYGTGI